MRELIIRLTAGSGESMAKLKPESYTAGTPHALPPAAFRLKQFERPA
ncbi:hypothetical protein [Microbacterium sp. LWS13-1.2]|uniref:50S ribosomal protein L33 n=1 Tax=Microbacterium sp. LWS13-1.2 TaxID=3135264 RepID=A0AAU6SFS8_9MICO